MRRRRPVAVAVAGALVLAAVATLAGCLSVPTAAPVAGPAARADCLTVWALTNGFHTSLALPPEAATAAGLDPAGAPWIEIGWGEARAYQAQSMNPLILAGAVVAPGPTTLFVSRLPFDPALYGPDQARRVTVSRAGLAVLIGDVASETARDAQGRPRILSVAENGTFIAARSRFGPFRNCNVWIAERLRRAGVVLPARAPLTARGLFAQLRRTPAACPT